MKEVIEVEVEVAKLNKENEIFGSFFLGGIEFAISAFQIQEVVNPPSHFTNMPLAQDYLLGLFNLRGTIIPVLDLAMLLKIKFCNGSSLEQKIAIIEYGGNFLGILFDMTGEIFKNETEERNDFNESSESVVSGVFRKEDGRRLIQILNLEQLFKLKGIPKQGENAQAARGKNFKNRRGQRKQSISFIVGPTKCALGIHEIQEILKVDKLNLSPLVGNHCIGTIDLRGTTVPIMDFAAFLGYRETVDFDSSTSSDRRILVMRIGDELFGLLVDTVDSIVSYYEDDFKTFPVLSRERIEMFSGCISLEGHEDILFLNGQRILTNSEILEITHGHNKLYNSNLHGLKDGKSSGSRLTYITFKVEEIHAVSIKEVREIIEHPKELLQLPDMPKYCKGVLNLRGDLVTIVDGRDLYGKPNPRSNPPKIMIFKAEGLHFGLVVDSVEEIVTITENEKVKLPSLLFRNEKQGSHAEFSEALQYKDLQNQSKNILVMSSDLIAARIKAA